MEPAFERKASKFLSLILRHKPETVGLTLSPEGWVDTDKLLAQMGTHGVKLTFEELNYIVETNDKQRFSFNPEKTEIRANQGHSVNIDLGLIALAPPEVLYHGTATRFLVAIEKDGLKKMKRNHVHLTASLDTATLVGRRHGKLALLKIDAYKMNRDGFQFFLSDNGVWLTDNVPFAYIQIEKE